MRLLFKTFIIFALILASFNSIDAQTKRNNVRSTQKQSPRQFYVTLKLGTGYANHSSINVYSKLGVDAKSLAN